MGQKNTVVNRDGMPLWQGVSKSVTPSTADTVLSLKNEQKSYKNIGGYANVTPCKF